MEYLDRRRTEGFGALGNKTVEPFSGTWRAGYFFLPAPSPIYP